MVAVVELDELTALGVVEAVDAGDAVAHHQHRADVGLHDPGVEAEVGELFLQYCRYFGGFDI